MNQTKTTQTVFRIVLVGVLSALCFVLSRYASVEVGVYMKFSFAGLPILLAALLYGPVDGMLVGLIGEFFSQLLGAYGLTATTPLWIRPSVVRGLLAGVVALAMHYRMSAAATSVTVIASSLVVTALNTFVMWFDAYLYHYATAAVLSVTTLMRFVSGVITAVLFCVILIPLIKALNRNGFGKGAVRE